MKLSLTFLAFAMFQASQPVPPARLADALKLEPGIRLLNPATDHREYSQPELEKFGYWPPWLEQDLDRDKRPDVVAVSITWKRPTESEAGFPTLSQPRISASDRDRSGTSTRRHGVTENHGVFFSYEKEFSV